LNNNIDSKSKIMNKLKQQKISNGIYIKVLIKLQHIHIAKKKKTMGIKVHIYSYIPIKVMASKHSKLHQSLKKDKHENTISRNSNLYIYIVP